MINNENELATNVQTLKECTDKGAWLADKENPCEKAFQEIMDFMKKDGSIQDALKSRELLKVEGNSLIFSPSLYPKEKKD